MAPCQGHPGTQMRNSKGELLPPCICEPGDPCDYHAATCVICPPTPNMETNKK